MNHSGREPPDIVFSKKRYAVFKFEPIDTRIGSDNRQPVVHGCKTLQLDSPAKELRRDQGASC